MTSAMTLERSQTLGSEFSPEELDPSWISGGRFRYPIISEADPWESTFKPVHRYDKEMCESWRDEVDKLLIFAGLFSAAVTAFTVESYKMLQPDPTDVLRTALASMNNQTSDATTEFEPEPFAIRVNIFWFLSLVLSLSTVVIGVLAMQWLREYQRGENNMAAHDALGLRQMRYQGLLTWRVPEIVSALPLLLQTAVFLFFCGVLDLLWSIHRVVAVAITIPVALLVVFLVMTTVLPALQYAFIRRLSSRSPQCPYKSPQSWVFHRIFSALCVFVFQISEYLNFKSMFRFETRERRSFLRGLFAASDWRAYDRRWRQQRDLQLSKPQPGGLLGQVIVRKDISHALGWFINSFSRDIRVITALYLCFQAMNDDEKEAMFLACERTSPLSIDFRNKLGGDGSPAVNDYLRLRTLDHLLSTIGYGLDGTQHFLQHRVELYIRVVRASIHIPQRPMLYCPFKYYSRFSEEVQMQLLGVATLFLSRSDRESDFATAIMILNQTSKHPALRSPSLIHAPEGLHADVEHIEMVDMSEKLKRTFSEALTEAGDCFLRRKDIIKHPLVRDQVYRWFLGVIQSTSSSQILFNLTLHTFMIIGPLVQSAIPSSVPDSEFPKNPMFKIAWKLLLEEKYSELRNVAALSSTTETIPSVA